MAHRRRIPLALATLDRLSRMIHSLLINPAYLRIAHGHSGGARPDVVQNLTATNTLSLIASNQLELRTAFQIGARPIQSTHMGRSAHYIRAS